MSICNHVADHLRGKQPKTTRQQRQLGMWNSYTKQPWGWWGEYNWVQPGYLHGGERREAACPSCNIWQEKQDNCSVQVRPGQDVSCAFVWSRAPNQARTQMEPDSIFWGFSSSFPLNSEKPKGLCVCVCVCVLAEYVSKSSSCFVWKRIKRSRGEMKIKRDAEFSGSTPWLNNNELK